jgi:hypothetical protein
MAYSDVPVYSIKLVEKDQATSTTIQVGGDEYILESAEDQGVKLLATQVNALPV